MQANFYAPNAPGATWLGMVLDTNNDGLKLYELTKGIKRLSKDVTIQQQFVVIADEFILQQEQSRKLLPARYPLIRGAYSYFDNPILNSTDVSKFVEFANSRLKGNVLRAFNHSLGQLAVIGATITSVAFETSMIANQNIAKEMGRLAMSGNIIGPPRVSKEIEAAKVNFAGYLSSFFSKGLNVLLNSHQERHLNRILKPGIFTENGEMKIDLIDQLAEFGFEAYRDEDNPTPLSKPLEKQMESMPPKTPENKLKHEAHTI